MKRRIPILLFLLVSVFLLGCVAIDEKKPAQDKGDIQIIYTPSSNLDDKALTLLLQESKLFEETARGLNDLLILPEDITVRLGSCGEVNAYYKSQTRTILMCYELMDYFGEVFREYTETNKELGIAMLQTMYFTFFHEFGHALVDTLDIPITGREEDAVDQLATITLIDAGLEDAALNAASWFLIEGTQKKVKELRFFDEHALDQQRFYNIICWVYGSNQKKHASLVAQGLLPFERAERCPAEYQKMKASWNVLLEPHVKK